MASLSGTVWQHSAIRECCCHNDDLEIWDLVDLKFVSDKNSFAGLLIIPLVVVDVAQRVERQIVEMATGDVCR